jgi:hypothetical protein
MRELQKVLDTHTDGSDPHFTHVLKAKVQAGGIAVATQAKVDEAALRAVTIGRLPDLIRLIHEEEAKIERLRALQSES